MKSFQRKIENAIPSKQFFLDNTKNANIYPRYRKSTELGKYLLGVLKIKIKS